jgi:voltage-gated potassium channel Kch
VNAHVPFQTTRRSKNLLANIALVLRSLSLPSSLRRSLFFSYLILLLNDFIKNDIIIITFIRYSQTQHSLFFSLQSFFSLLSVARDHHRFHVFRSFRMCILSSVFARH